MALFYRLRTVDRAIDEIEHEHIYFARPNQLNDPMEGYHDIFWQGDLVVWRNLFRHYLLCFERTLRFFIMGCSIPPLENLVLSRMDNMPSPQYGFFFNELVSDIFGETPVSDYIERIANRTTKVRRDELCFYLDAFTACAINKIVLSYKKLGEFEAPILKDLKSSVKPCDSLPEESFFEKLNHQKYDLVSRDLYGKLLFMIRGQLNEKIIHSNYIKLDAIIRPSNEALLDFGRLYVKYIERLVYPEWAAVCFMNDCKSSSAWSHYGDQHTGIGMIFGSDNDPEGECINLNGIVSYGSSGHSERKFLFHQINYTKKMIEVDFFGSLSLPIPSLKSTWYTDYLGGISTFACRLSQEKLAEHYKRHWMEYRKVITSKTKDWAYENEYRLMLLGDMEDISSNESRTLKYNFDSLVGIIFGINTSRFDKLRIRQIVYNKCNNYCRDTFKFYQAFYSHESGSIEHMELL